MKKKRKAHLKELPPGTYAAQVMTVRKVRNRNELKMTCAVGGIPLVVKYKL